jgi:hypothetical protein
VIPWDLSIPPRGSSTLVFMVTYFGRRVAHPGHIGAARGPQTWVYKYTIPGDGSIIMPKRPQQVKGSAPSAGSVAAAQPGDHRAGGGATPILALQSLQVGAIPFWAAKELLKREHYLHSFPGGTQLAFGVFVENRLLGALILGSGPANAYALVEGAQLRDYLSLTRLWLSDQLPPNSESRVLGIVLRALKRSTDLKFLITYADPTQGHLGYIYQATGWVYTGLSQGTPHYDTGDGKPYHSRTLSQIYGTHSIKYLGAQGLNAR